MSPPVATATTQWVPWVTRVLIVYRLSTIDTEKQVGKSPALSISSSLQHWPLFLIPSNNKNRSKKTKVWKNHRLVRFWQFQTCRRVDIRSHKTEFAIRTPWATTAPSPALPALQAPAWLAEPGMLLGPLPMSLSFPIKIRISASTPAASTSAKGTHSIRLGLCRVRSRSSPKTGTQNCPHRWLLSSQWSTSIIKKNLE